VSVAAERLTGPSPRPGEVWLTLGLSVLLHALLTFGIVLVPHFRIGTYITVPVSYTVNLVSSLPGNRAGGPGPAPAPRPPAAAPAPAPAAPAVQPAPAPRITSRPSEELTLPGKRAPQKATTPDEPSLRPPPVSGRERVRPSPAAPPAPLTPAVPLAPAAPVAPAPPVASASVGAGGGGSSAGAGASKESGVEVAGGEGGGGTTLAYYLTLVDRKIQDNWVPVGGGTSPESVVVVRFRVLRSGQVRDVELDASSGNASLDASALRAVRASLPLPPFPNLLAEPFLNLRYRFVMERG